jgi:DNA segregation ATPase FtsK/SpoIIIE, S-DNA-T family
MAARAATARSPQGGTPQRVTGFMVRRAEEAAGLLLLALGVALALALFGHDPGDPSFNHLTDREAVNPMGRPGAHAADLALQMLGYAAWLLPPVLVAWGARLIGHRPLVWWWLPVAALPLALLAATAHLAAWPVHEVWPLRVGLGGFVGDFQLLRLQPGLGAEAYRSGSAAIAVVAAVTALGLRFGESSRALVLAARGLWWSTRHGARLLWRLVALLAALVGLALRGVVRLVRGRDEDRPRRRLPSAGTEEDPETLASRLSAAGLVAATSLREALSGALDYGRRAAPESDEESRAAWGRPPSRPNAPPSRPAAPPPAEPIEAYEPESPFELPPLDLLGEVRKEKDAGLSRQQLEQNARNLETVLDDFGVRGEIVDAKPGPVITLYELEPAPGTRAARVISLADDIARSLCARSVRVAVVPGRNVIGIELPNDRRETVYLRELLASPAYEDTASRLMLALGKDISGNPMVVDLSRMPHLLIAGTTGSGKSVAINAMILSLLYRLPPDQCRMIMIDPKVIELSVYEGIPHLLAPVVTEPSKAIVALKWVVREMDERYRRMSHVGVRDIQGYNRRMGEVAVSGDRLTRRVQTGFEPASGLPIYEEQELDTQPMPLIVVIVDEVADLMMTAGKEIESAIQRLSQKARAAGIHLIVATQRPSVDVLTGVIKANLPSRISFRVSSKIDSRTILGEPGAEQLLGQGDMLYLMPGDRITRIHGPLVTEREVEKVVGFLRAQGEPEYLDAVTSEAAQEQGQGELPLAEAENEDAQYQQAVQIVVREKKASTSFLQRKLRIGYNSAARLIERMEEDGLISQANHVGQRQVLLGREEVDEPW